MPDHLPTIPPLPPSHRNDYSHGPVSGAATEPEQPLVVLGDGGTEMDDVMVLAFAGASIQDQGGNHGLVVINFQLNIYSNNGDVLNAKFLDFDDIERVTKESPEGAKVQIFPNLPGSGTFVLASVNNGFQWLPTTTC